MFSCNCNNSSTFFLDGNGNFIAYHFLDIVRLFFFFHLHNLVFISVNFICHFISQSQCCDILYKTSQTIFILTNLNNFIPSVQYQTILYFVDKYVE